MIISKSDNRKFPSVELILESLKNNKLELSNFSQITGGQTSRCYKCIYDNELCILNLRANPEGAAELALDGHLKDLLKEVVPVDEIITNGIIEDGDDSWTYALKKFKGYNPYADEVCATDAEFEYIYKSAIQILSDLASVDLGKTGYGKLGADTFEALCGSQEEFVLANIENQFLSSDSLKEFSSDLPKLITNAKEFIKANLNVPVQAQGATAIWDTGWHNILVERNGTQLELSAFLGLRQVVVNIDPMISIAPITLWSENPSYLSMAKNTLADCFQENFEKRMHFWMLWRALMAISSYIRDGQKERVKWVLGLLNKFRLV